MGRSHTPTFRLDCEGGEIFTGSTSWDCKRDGRPTPRNIEKFLTGYLQSCAAGGVNEHLCRPGRTAQGEPTRRLPALPRRARVVRQRTGETVAEWAHPPFLTF